MCTMYIKKTTASLYTYRPLIRVAVVGITHPTYSYSFHLRYKIYIYIYIHIYIYPTSGNHLRHWPTEPKQGKKTSPNCQTPDVSFFLSSFKAALEISKPTKGIALVQVSAKVIRCDFSVFLVGLPPMIKWSNRKVGGIHLARLTWNLKIHPWKRRNIFQTIIFRFYVNLGGCMFFLFWPLIGRSVLEKS